MKRKPGEYVPQEDLRRQVICNWCRRMVADLLFCTEDSKASVKTYHKAHCPGRT